MAAALTMVAGQAAASGDCVTAIAESARRHNVPQAVALTVGKVESGHDSLALNIAGRPARAYSVADGVIAIGKLRAAGITSVDVGCMQINLKHHPRAFSSLEQAFDPAANAEYGVLFLKQLHAAKGNWARAIASYHSSDPERQTVYLSMVRQKLVQNLAMAR